MRLKKNNTVTLQGKDDTITIKRSKAGIPEITASTPIDLAYGNGWIHANDRLLHMMLTRVIMKGEASEKLSADDALVELDRYIRRMRFAPDIEQQVDQLTEETRSELTAYCNGINDFMDSHGQLFEFKLLGYKPEPWTILDSLRQVKAFTWLGLTYAQGDMEKLIVQLIQEGVSEEKLRELYPYLTDTIDVDLIKKVTLQNPLVPESLKWLETIPRFTASNNWAVAGDRTASGNVMMCGDPHLEVNRLPGIWHEVILRLPDNSFFGVGVPGAPGILIGRSSYLSWSATYSFMDMIDYRIEECKEGKYRRGDRWIDFTVHEEIIRTKKGETIRELVYENQQGILEGDPHKPGFYLVGNLATRYNAGAGDLNASRGVMNSKNAEEAVIHFRGFECSTYNWVMGDTSGNIAYQMSGRYFNRPKENSGLVPHPAWDRKYDYDGFVSYDKLPREINPGSGIIVTANQDLNHLGECSPINLPMAPYRAERITELLEKNDSVDVDYMKFMHYDLYSLQAEKFMAIISPLLPESAHGKTLKEWDLQYTEESTGAVIFENIYLSLLKVVFGDNGLGRDVVEHLMSETGVFNDYYGNFDAILLKEDSLWFNGRKKEELILQAIEEGLTLPVKPYGQTRMLVFSHMLFGGMVPKFFGFDRGPISLPGGRATIPQGQIFTSAGRTTSFSPSYRFITDMSKPDFHCNITGGISDRRFSSLYFNRNNDWLKGIYTVLT